MRLSKELSHKTLWANLRQLWYTMHGLHDILHAMRSTPQIDLVCIRQFYPNILPNSAYLLTRCRSSLFNLTFFVIFLNSACIPSILMYFLLFHWFFLNLAQFTPILQFALILFNSAQFQFSLIFLSILWIFISSGQNTLLHVDKKDFIRARNIKIDKLCSFPFPLGSF